MDGAGTPCGLAAACRGPDLRAAAPGGDGMRSPPAPSGSALRTSGAISASRVAPPPGRPAPRRVRALQRLRQRGRRGPAAPLAALHLKSLRDPQGARRWQRLYARRAGPRWTWTCWWRRPTWTRRRALGAPVARPSGPTRAGSAPHHTGAGPTRRDRRGAALPGRRPGLAAPCSRRASSPAPRPASTGASRCGCWPPRTRRSTWRSTRGHGLALLWLSDVKSLLVLHGGLDWDAWRGGPASASPRGGLAFGAPPPGGPVPPRGRALSASVARAAGSAARASMRWPPWSTAAALCRPRRLRRPGRAARFLAVNLASGRRRTAGPGPGAPGVVA